MPTIKAFFSFFFALVFAVLSSISVSHYLQNRESVTLAKPAAEPTVSVVVAVNDMGMGMKITEADLEVHEWPKEAVSEQYFQSLKPVIGRTLRSSLIAGEPVADSKLLKEGENLSMLIPDGMRAVTVSIRRSKTLARVLERGSIVDVVAIIGDDSRMNSKVIAQGARVLAVDNPTDRAGASKEAIESSS